MKKTLLILALLLSGTVLWAQESMVREDLEILIDSLDQELQPRRFSGGLMVGGNTSNFIIHNQNSRYSSHMSIGAQLGGILDFYIFRQFAVQGQLIFTAEQNVFREKYESADHLWSFGMTLPVYFLWRHRDPEKGIVSIGGGPFTHFTFASNVGKYTNAIQPMAINDSEELEKVYKLHANHSGLGAIASYEFPMGILIQAGYQISLSDIFSYINNAPEDFRRDTKIYPQRISLSLGYRFKSNRKKTVIEPQYPIIID